MTASTQHVPREYEQNARKRNTQSTLLRVSTITAFVVFAMGIAAYSGLVDTTALVMDTVSVGLLISAVALLALIPFWIFDAGRQRKGRTRPSPRHAHDQHEPFRGFPPALAAHPALPVLSALPALPGTMLASIEVDPTSTAPLPDAPRTGMLGAVTAVQAADRVRLRLQRKQKQEQEQDQAQAPVLHPTQIMAD